MTVAKHQEIRNQLEKGMRVNVLIRISETVVKRKPAVIVDVKRSVASVRYEHEIRARTVRFNEIELLPDASGTLKPPPTVQRPALPAPAKASSPPLAPAVAESPSAFEAWLEMGAEIEAELEQKVAELRTEKAGLEDEHAEIGMQLDEVTKRYADAHASLEAIRKIRRTKAS